MLSIFKRRAQRAPNARRATSAVVDAVESRLLYSTTLVGKTTYSAGIEISGPFTVNGFLLNQAWNHGHTGSAGYSDWNYLEFGSGGGLSPGGISVGDIDSITINLYNTAASGNFGGQPGNFSVYFAPDNNTDPSTLRYTGGVNNNASTTTKGFDVLKIAGNTAQGQLGMSDGSAGFPASTKIGSATFSSSDATSVGYHPYTFTNLSLAAKQGIANDLNTGKAVRVAIVPDDSNLLADWEGNYSINYPTMSVTVEPAVSVASTVGLNAATYTVNKTAGTASLTVNRTIGTGFTDAGSTVSYTTSNITALAGTNYTATSGQLIFAPGQTSATITVPILDPGHNAMDGDKTFKLTLSNPSANTTLDAGGTSATVTIVDTDIVTLSQYSSDNATVQPGGVRPGATGKTYFNIAGSSAGTSASYGVLDFNGTGPMGTFTFDVPSGKDVSEIVNLSVDTTQGFPASSFNATGPMNVYLVSDTSTSINNDGSSPLVFDAGSLPDGLGDQLGSKVLLGTYVYNANEATDVFTSHLLSTVDATGAATLIQDLNTGTKFRIVIAAGNSSVEASLEGQYTFNQYEAPKITFGTYVVDEGTGLPSWVGAGSIASWDAGAHVLTVTGATTIIADPGTDLPVINASGAAASILVSPTTTDEFIHIGGLTLASGATLSVASVSGRTHDHHLALVLGSAAGGAPVFSVDTIGGSAVDLEDNDLIVHNGDLASVQALAAAGRNVAPGGVFDGTWDGNGLRSSAAASTDAGAGLETTVLALVRNSDLFLGAFSTWQIGSQQEQLQANGNDIIVKYTYNGDVSLEGQVGDDAATVLGFYYDAGATSGHNWANGDLNGDGVVDDNDATALGFLFGNGVSSGPLL